MMNVGRIALMIFGEPKQKYEEARAGLLSALGVFLYNRWKNEAVSNPPVASPLFGKS